MTPTTTAIATTIVDVLIAAVIIAAVVIAIAIAIAAVLHDCSKLDIGTLSINRDVKRRKARAKVLSLGLQVQKDLVSKTPKSKIPKPQSICK